MTGNIMIGRRHNDAEDIAALIAVFRVNNDVLNRIARASFMSREQVVALAIQHFGSLPLKKQWELGKQYLSKPLPV